MNAHRFAKSLLLLCFAIWLVAWGWALPALISSAYAGQSSEFFNNLITGQQQHDLNYYLDKIRYIFLLGVAFHILAGMVLFSLPAKPSLGHSLCSAWNRYWFRSSPTFFLGLARIVCVFTVLALLIPGDYSRLEHLAGSFRPPSTLYDPLLLNKILFYPFFGSSPPPHSVITGILWTSVASGILALIGYKTRLAVFVFALTQALLVAHKYSFRDFHHPEALMVIALFLFALSPSGRSLSLDAYLINRRLNGTDRFGLNAKSYFAAWPLLLAQCLLAIGYLDSGIQKLYHSGWAWMEGDTLAFFLWRDSIGRGSELAPHLLQHPWLLTTLSIATIAFELGFILVIIWPRLAWLFVPIGLGFHIGNLVLHIAPFFEFMALYVTFLPQLLGRWPETPATCLRGDQQLGAEANGRSGRDPAIPSPPQRMPVT